MNATQSEGVYVDTSVLGAYYCPEALIEKAEGALRKIPRPVISSLIKDAFSGIDAVGQAALVHEKKVTSPELVDAAIAEYFDKARRQAKIELPASPLSGLPYLIKDLYEIKGEITTSGSRLMATHIGADNSLLAQKAIDAGMIVIGMSNTPEFGLMASTESLQLGACQNPWNTVYSSGGSSGGAAA
jgi:amidase